LQELQNFFEIDNGETSDQEKPQFLQKFSNSEFSKNLLKVFFRHIESEIPENGAQILANITQNTEI
jgi:hypothetical protein